MAVHNLSRGIVLTLALGMLLACGRSTDVSVDNDAITALDEPCQLDLADVRDRPLGRSVERDAEVVEELVDWRAGPLQGVTYDVRAGRLLLTVDPLTSAVSQARAEQQVRAALSGDQRTPVEVRRGCFPNSTLADIRDELLTGTWLDGVDAAFAVSYDADDGRLRLDAEPEARAAANNAVDIHEPALRFSGEG